MVLLPGFNTFYSDGFSRMQRNNKHGFFHFVLSKIHSFNIFLKKANNADPDEMTPCALFHLALRCLPKYPITDIQNKIG